MDTLVHPLFKPFHPPPLPYTPFQPPPPPSHSPSFPSQPTLLLFKHPPSYLSNVPHLSLSNLHPPTLQIPTVFPFQTHPLSLSLSFKPHPFSFQTSPFSLQTLSPFKPSKPHLVPTVVLKLRSPGVLLEPQTSDHRGSLFGYIYPILRHNAAMS